MYDSDPRRISVAPPATALPVNGTAAFTAVVRTGYGPTQWSAGCGAIDAGGTYTAPPDPGTCVVGRPTTASRPRRRSVQATAVQVEPASATVRAGGVIDADGAFTAGRVPGAYAVRAANNGAVGQAAVTVVPWLGTDIVGVTG